MTFRLWKEGRSLSDSWKGAKVVTTVKPKCGIKVLHEPPNAIVDLVFVHGITGHRDYTWSADQSGEPWPKLLLAPLIPEARILTFGYDASVIGFWRGISGNSIAEHSDNLLSALSCFRSEAEFRPIIFVAHSLGGLVVKDALLSSRTSPEPHLRRILDCAQAILFLGTPHYGADLAGIGQRLVGLAGLAAAAAAAAVQTNQKIVGVLQRDSEVLSRIQKGFQELLRSQHQGGGSGSGSARRPLDITCCYEELPLMGVGEIVPSESAILHGYPAIGIHADHRGMARFASADDPGFVSVLGELRRWISQIAVAYAEEGYDDDNYDGHDKEVWDVKRKGTNSTNSSSGSSNTLGGWAGGGGGGGGGVGGRRRGGGDREDCGRAGAITIWGNVTKSIIANGNQTIQGNLIFGGS